jgi:eukaryotic-like serine/threonine-protein kinase
MSRRRRGGRGDDGRAAGAEPPPAPPRPPEAGDPGIRELPRAADADDLKAKKSRGRRESDPHDDPDFDPHALELPLPPPPRRHRIATALSMAALAIAAFGIGLFLFNDFVMPRFIHGTAEVRVPDLTNLTLPQAERQASALQLQLSRSGERFDPSVPSGFILSQDPPEGTPVRGRRRVMVVVSLGEEFSSVPALFGESQRGARLLIERAGLVMGGLTRAPSDEVGSDLVVSSDPPAESVLPRGTHVSLMISAGAGHDEYVMPDLLGRELSAVRRQLEALGFRVGTPPGAPAAGAIVFQDPPAGSKVTRDASVTLQAMGRMIR